MWFRLLEWSPGVTIWKDVFEKDGNVWSCSKRRRSRWKLVGAELSKHNSPNSTEVHSAQLSLWSFTGHLYDFPLFLHIFLELRILRLTRLVMHICSINSIFHFRWKIYLKIGKKMKIITNFVKHASYFLCLNSGTLLIIKFYYFYNIF